MLIEIIDADKFKYKKKVFQTININAYIQMFAASDSIQRKSCQL